MSLQDHSPRVYYKMGLSKVYECAYYNETTGTWIGGEESGCIMESDDSGKVSCTCDHMTSFAVIMVRYHWKLHWPGPGN